MSPVVLNLYKRQPVRFLDAFCQSSGPVVRMPVADKYLWPDFKKPRVCFKHRFIVLKGFHIFQITDMRREKEMVFVSQGKAALLLSAKGKDTGVISGK